MDAVTAYAFIIVFSFILPMGPTNPTTDRVAYGSYDACIEDLNSAIVLFGTLGDPNPDMVQVMGCVETKGDHTVRQRIEKFDSMGSGASPG
jgi:hypothetical protein